MKFLCDRCKTRYSIADERVHGKILKIRCKNCSNVITVREGMPEPEAESPEAAEARRQSRPTDYAPAIVGAAPGKQAPASTLQNAFAQAMEKPAAPPQQLEEEWYVSIDGDQSGPFSLTDAQAWVKARKLDDELFCWCEGFDDWLPVEKVSHFRGLRKKATPPPPTRPGPPAPPRPGTGPVKALSDLPRTPREEEPKPLFAAALAALEAEVARPDTTPDPVPLVRGASAGLSQLPTPRPATIPPPVAAPPIPAARPAPQLAKATPSTGTPAAPALPHMFDTFDGEDSAVAAAPPIPDRSPISLSDLSAPPAKPSNGHGAGAADFDHAAAEEELAIGEVSRVVRLHDIARRPATAPIAAVAARNATGAVPRVQLESAAAPASALAHAATASLHDEVHGEAPPVDAPVIAPVVPVAKRKHTTVIAAGVVALLGLIGLVVFLASSGSDDGDESGVHGGGGDVEDLARTIDDPRFPRSHVGTGATPGTASDPGTVKNPRNPRYPRTGTGTGTGTGTATGTGTGPTEMVVGPDGQPLEPLEPDDVVTQAQKNATGTQRCYERALKKDPFLKVKSIAAVISIGADGKVSSVTLDQLQAEPLGQCLVAAIKRWPFRHSTAGINTKITLKFEQTLGP